MVGPKNPMCMALLICTLEEFSLYFCTQHYSVLCRASVTSFFTAYDALCEEGLAGTVTKVLNDIADNHLPGICPTLLSEHEPL